MWTTIGFGWCQTLSHIFKQRQTGNEDAVARVDLKVCRRISQLHNRLMTNRQHNAFLPWFRRTNKNDFMFIGFCAQTTGSNQRIQDCFVAGQRIRTGSHDLSKDVEPICFLRNQSHGNVITDGWSGRIA